MRVEGGVVVWCGRESRRRWFYYCSSGIRFTGDGGSGHAAAVAEPLLSLLLVTPFQQSRSMPATVNKGILVCGEVHTNEVPTSGTCHQPPTLLGKPFSSDNAIMPCASQSEHSTTRRNARTPSSLTLTLLPSSAASAPSTFYKRLPMGNSGVCNMAVVPGSGQDCSYSLAFRADLPSCHYRLVE